MTSLPVITPAEARELIARGGALIDIREPGEHARARIAGARNLPLSALPASIAADAPALVFHCKSGARTTAHAARLAAAAGCPAYLLDGGIDAWQRAGLPVAVDRRQPIEIMRQVQIAAGTLILIGMVLGVAVAPAFLGLAAFVGAGLLMAGVTGWCGMARLLAMMPWNRRAAA